MKKTFFKIVASIAACILISSVSAQSTSDLSKSQNSSRQSTGNGTKSTVQNNSNSPANSGNYSITGASKDEVRGASGQNGTHSKTYTSPDTKRKSKVTSPAANNTNATNGSNIAPGR